MMASCIMVGMVTRWLCHHVNGCLPRLEFTPGHALIPIPHRPASLTRCKIEMYQRKILVLQTKH